MSALFNQGAASAPSSTTGDISKDVEVAQNLLPTDSISALAWSPTHDFLAVAAWDKAVRIYEISGGSVNGKWSIPCAEVPLCVAWSEDGTKIAAGGNEGSIFFVDLSTQQAGGEAKPIPDWKPHQAGVKGICFFKRDNKDWLATGSWDKTVQFWDFTSTTACTKGITCAERVYSMDTRSNLLVVATAERHIHVINLGNSLDSIYKTIQSPLKWQTRVVSCFSDATGFAVGSIEGRCAIQYVEDKDTSLNFSFKCHRQQDPTSRDIAKVYSVNAISFHPHHGTFSTAGSDGTFHFWDKDAKHRLKGYPDVGGSITATGFSRDGNIFAYAISYDWSKGYAANNQTYPIKLKLHPVAGDECKPRPGNKKR
ncbi:WD40 repeat-like protein [Massarina eburnea CBS 473.64]|uniref:WD40 repeat-like protein n=1 Tax=Massarina eburnea CBS 473.64 TaxID=1395130 RepID=A0A6A6RL93_9PLEO|nr:WD40 repeat-like protein [Massarina eburnea CBS 473.64]